MENIVLHLKTVAQEMIKEREVLTNGLKEAELVKNSSKTKNKKEQRNIDEAVLWYKGALKS